MGRKRSTKKSSTARRKKKNDTIGLDFIGGILIAIGVILLVILCVALILIMFVAFAPLRYKIIADYDLEEPNKDVYCNVKLSWLASI